MITDIKFECSSCGQKMLVDAEAAGMHADCPACGTHVDIPKVRAINEREYAPSKAIRKREGSRSTAAAVGNGSHRRNGTDSSPTFSDPEISGLRQELVDASVQTSELERELQEAREEVSRLRAELGKASSDVEARRKLQDELKRLTLEHEALCTKYTAAASDRDTAVACTEQMANEIEQLRKRSEAAEGLMDEAHEEMQKLRAEGVELAQAVASAQEEIAALSRSFNEREIELADERARHVETQSDRTIALRRIDEIERQQKESELEIAALRASLADAEQVAAQVEPTKLTLEITATKLAVAEGRVAELEKELSDITIEVQSLRRSLSENSAGQDLMIARDQLAEVTREQERLQGEVRHLTDDVKSLTAAKAEQDERVKVLTRELDEARRRAEAASEARLRQDNEVLRGIIARQNSELEQRHAQLTRLRRARFGVRLAYASFALGLVLIAAWAIKMVPGLQLLSF